MLGIWPKAVPTIGRAITNAASNTIIGNDANNVIDGSLGADTLIGGLGDDTYVVDNTGDVVTEQDGGPVDLGPVTPIWTPAR